MSKRRANLLAFIFLINILSLPDDWSVNMKLWILSIKDLFPKKFFLVKWSLYNLLLLNAKKSFSMK